MLGVYIKHIEGVWFGAACDEKEIFATSFAFSKENALHSLFSGIPYDAPFQQLEKPSVLAELVLAQLKNVYDGMGFSEILPLATKHVSEYARRVIEVTSSIPLGYVASYGAVAKVAGGSPRAVGRVMATHPFAPIVPCHRVVSSDLTLGGYGGGLEVKLAFLKREKKGYATKREIAVNGKKLQVLPVEFVLKRLEKGKR